MRTPHSVLGFLARRDVMVDRDIPRHPLGSLLGSLARGDVSAVHGDHRFAWGRRLSPTIGRTLRRDSRTSPPRDRPSLAGTRARRACLWWPGTPPSGSCRPGSAAVGRRCSAALFTYVIRHSGSNVMTPSGMLSRISVSVTSRWRRCERRLSTCLSSIDGRGMTHGVTRQMQSIRPGSNPSPRGSVHVCGYDSVGWDPIDVA